GVDRPAGGVDRRHHDAEAQRQVGDAGGGGPGRAVVGAGDDAVAADAVTAERVVASSDQKGVERGVVGDGADHLGGQAVADRVPGAAAVGGLPDAAGRGRDPEVLGDGRVGGEAGGPAGELHVADRGLGVVAVGG